MFVFVSKYGTGGTTLCVYNCVCELGEEIYKYIETNRLRVLNVLCTSLMVCFCLCFEKIKTPQSQIFSEYERKIPVSTLAPLENGRS